MNTAETPSVFSPFTRLRKFARTEEAAERCELCRTAIGPKHEHLLELKDRKLHCACEACAILFGDETALRYRRVPSRIIALGDLDLSDQVWESLHVPINLAFFYNNSTTGKVVAMYP